MIRKIKNPFRNIEGHNCFGCSPDNPHGLQMNFYEEGEVISSIWEPGDNYQGYKNILHGGIQSTLMDELASWYVFTKLKTAGLTAKIEVRFLKPVRTDKGEIKLEATLSEMHHRLACISVKLFDRDRNLCSRGLITYYVFSEEYARTKLDYPDFGNFFEDN